MLRRIGFIATAKKVPPLSKENIKKRLIWAKENMKVDFTNVIFTEECRASLDGPDGFSRGWFRNGVQVPNRLRKHQGGGGVMFWAAIYNNMLIGIYLI